MLVVVSRGDCIWAGASGVCICGSELLVPRRILIEWTIMSKKERRASGSCLTLNLDTASKVIGAFGSDENLTGVIQAGWLKFGFIF